MLSLKRLTQIENAAKRLSYKYHTQDPYELAAFLDIMVDLQEYESTDLLGFSCIVLNHNVIGINGGVEYDTRKCTCAHELGHIVLRHLRSPEFRLRHLCELSNMTAGFEAEANAFGASLLIGDDEALEAIRYYRNAKCAAASLYVCEELFLAKMDILRAKGHPLRQVELDGRKAWRGYANAGSERSGRS